MNPTNTYATMTDWIEPTVRERLADEETKCHQRLAAIADVRRRFDDVLDKKTSEVPALQVYL